MKFRWHVDHEFSAKTPEAALMKIILECQFRLAKLQDSTYSRKRPECFLGLESILEWDFEENLTIEEAVINVGSRWATKQTGDVYEVYDSTQSTVWARRVNAEMTEGGRHWGRFAFTLEFDHVSSPV